MAARLVPYAPTGITRSGTVFRSAAGALALNVANNLANRAINSATNYISNTAAQVPSYLRNAYNSYRQPRNINSSMSRMRMRRRMPRRNRYRRRFRRSAKRTNWRGRVRRPKWTGNRYNKRGSRRSLNTDFSRNDRDSVRTRLLAKSFQVDSTASVTNNIEIVVSGNDVAAAFPTPFAQYDEFKLSNIQVVIQPRTFGDNRNNYTITPGELPYLLVREGNPSETFVSSISYNKALVTPGYRYVPVFRKSRSVFNLKPGGQFVRSMREAGSNVSVVQNCSVGWLRTDTLGTQFDQCKMEIVTPKFLLGSDILLFDVIVYASCQFRGNTSELIKP